MAMLSIAGWSLDHGYGYCPFSPGPRLPRRDVGWVQLLLPRERLRLGRRRRPPWPQGVCLSPGLGGSFPAQTSLSSGFPIGRSVVLFRE